MSFLFGEFPLAWVLAGKHTNRNTAPFFRGVFEQAHLRTLAKVVFGILSRLNEKVSGQRVGCGFSARAPRACVGWPLVLVRCTTDVLPAHRDAHSDVPGQRDLMWGVEPAAEWHRYMAMGHNPFSPQ